ncbi:hypothetical protein ACN27F_13300 [Solwaraspora sp. WMMB335]|uniref:hypothetical protein n=1 Tax=Solwaraspora sp. WMMB335 TaxID=3404118 RepID=UPI003B95B33A
MDETMLMTGASREIGWHAAVAMLAADPGLRMFVTDHTGGLAEGLRDKNGNPQVYGVPADLSSLDSVRAAADHVMARAAVTSFVGDAGLQVTGGARRSADGYEVTFAVDVLANHLLLRLLGDQLRRVVITGSDTHFGDLRHNLGLAPAPRWRPPTELARPDQPDTAVAGRTAYSTSKFSVVYLVHEWAAGARPVRRRRRPHRDLTVGAGTIVLACTSVSTSRPIPTTRAGWPPRSAGCGCAGTATSARS